MITCERAAERMSMALDDRLALGGRLALAVHRFTCGKCRRYARLLADVDRGVRDFFTESAVAAADLPEESAERIKTALRDEAE